MHERHHDVCVQSVRVRDVRLDLLIFAPCDAGRARTCLELPRLILIVAEKTDSQLALLEQQRLVRCSQVFARSKEAHARTPNILHRFAQRSRAVVAGMIIR
jgi:hypothetical protein